MDICERLTQKAGDLRSAVTPSHRLADLLEDAKAEIERRSADAKKLHNDYRIMNDKICQQQDEIERLRRRCENLEESLYLATGNREPYFLDD